jgi:D-alanyl-D-alanine carboxypeptidase
MITRTLILYTLLSLVKAHLCAQELPEKLRHIVDTTFAAHPAATGMMVGIVHDDGTIWNYAVGVSDKDSKQALTPNQPVLVASNTKTYIAAAILRLVGQKKLALSETVAQRLPQNTLQKLTAAGYDTRKITITHLLSHTSGIADYVDDGYFQFVNENRKHKWSRDEQIERAFKIGKALASPGDTFRYADINYLLLTEIIENITKKPFYTSVRELLKFKSNKINTTWFAGLEPTPPHASALAHQYWDKYQWDSYGLDPSWDLFGGGGIAATAADLALFFKKLFEGKIITGTVLLSRMHTNVACKAKTNYCLGLRKLTLVGETAYYHGGFWGTDAVYFPKLKTAICIVILEKSEQDLSASICKAMAGILLEAKRKH